MTWPAAIAVCLALLVYLRSPIDLVPDRLGGIGLLDDLLVIVIVIFWMRRRFARARSERSGPATEATAWDPHEVLGVPHDASTEEVARAYREQMRRYHPDHVAHLGDELQELAHRRTLDIQRAYGELGRP